MRKLLTILLILMLLVSQVGYYFIYAFLQHGIREQVERQMLAGLPESSLDIIAADHKDIVWEEEGREFSLNGSLYDVVKIRKLDGKVFIYCVNDAKEEELLRDLAKVAAAGNAANKQKGGKHVVKLPMNDFVSDMNEKEFPTQLYKAQRYPDFVADICSMLKKVDSPPPRFYIL